MIKKIRIYSIYLIPKYWITKLSGWIAKKNAGFFTQLLILIFIKIYKVNMKEAKNEKISFYNNFNDFFTRELKKNARQIISGKNKLALPADGIITELGHITKNQLLHIKNQFYKLNTLFAGNNILTNKFNNGLFLITYLSPKDYHRVHIPCDGLLKKMIFVPGTLFPVNQFAINNIPNILVRNERLICIFDTSFGAMAQIFIGATITGSIHINCYGCINKKRERIIRYWNFSQKNKTKNKLYFKKGSELGKFKLGSTVINIFEYNSIKFNPLLTQGSISKVGELLGESINSSQKIHKKNNLTKGQQNLIIED